MCGIDYNRFPEWDKCNFIEEKHCYFCGIILKNDAYLYDDELDSCVCINCAEDM